MQNDRWKRETGLERGDSSHACHFFSVIFLNLGLCVSSGRPAVGIYSPMGCLLIKHMWTCRGMGRDRGLRTASLCMPALATHAQEQIHSYVRRLSAFVYMITADSRILPLTLLLLLLFLGLNRNIYAQYPLELHPF